MSDMPQREAYGRALADYGDLNKKVVVLDADTSSSTLTHFLHPGRRGDCFWLLTGRNRFLCRSKRLRWWANPIGQRFTGGGFNYRFFWFFDGTFQATQPIW